MSLLKSLPIDRIKIDRTFVQALPDDKHSRELCRTIINLADSLGMVVTAEGIETQAQRQFLQSLHCQEGQVICSATRWPSPIWPSNWARARAPGASGVPGSAPRQRRR